MIFNNDVSVAIQHIESSIKNAENNYSKLPNDILDIDGFSGNKTRHLYNNICNIPDINYLEIGTYMGSTFISAMYQNSIHGIAVDNWSEFNGPKNKCIENINKYIDKNNFKLIEKNFLDLNEIDLPYPIDVYLYDGDHSYEAHVKAITNIKQFLSPLSIILIDDFRSDQNWKRVIDGTMDGFDKSKLNIAYHKHINSYYEIDGRKNFWNGCGIFLCQK